MSRTQLYCFAFAFFLFAQNTNAEDLKVEPDKENVVASRIIGDWQASGDLNERLGKEGGEGGELPTPMTVTFTDDPTIVKNIPEKYVGAFAKNNARIYLAGMMDFGGESSPFVLTTVRGNPHIVFWRKVDDDPFGNGESFNVMLAVASEKKNDLMFIGGDFNNQAFSAFERIDAPRNE